MVIYYTYVINGQTKLGVPVQIYEILYIVTAISATKLCIILCSRYNLSHITRCISYSKIIPAGLLQFDTFKLL